MWQRLLQNLVDLIDQVQLDAVAVSVELPTKPLFGEGALVPTPFNPNPVSLEDGNLTGLRRTVHRDPLECLRTSCHETTVTRSAVSYLDLRARPSKAKLRIRNARRSTMTSIGVLAGHSGHPSSYFPGLMRMRIS
jgi:hypothetical protein